MSTKENQPIQLPMLVQQNGEWKVDPKLIIRPQDREYGGKSPKERLEIEQKAEWFQK